MRDFGVEKGRVHSPFGADVEKYTPAEEAFVPSVCVF